MRLVVLPFSSRSLHSSKGGSRSLCERCGRDVVLFSCSDPRSTWRAEDRRSSGYISWCTEYRQQLPHNSQILSTPRQGPPAAGWTCLERPLRAKQCVKNFFYNVKIMIHSLWCSWELFSLGGQNSPQMNWERSELAKIEEPLSSLFWFSTGL